MRSRARNLMAETLAKVFAFANAARKSSCVIPLLKMETQYLAAVFVLSFKEVALARFMDILQKEMVRRLALCGEQCMPAATTLKARRFLFTEGAGLLFAKSGILLRIS